MLRHVSVAGVLRTVIGFATELAIIIFVSLGITGEITVKTLAVVVFAGWFLINTFAVHRSKLVTTLTINHVIGIVLARVNFTTGGQPFFGFTPLVS
jgi:hypothetical protein